MNEIEQAEIDAAQFVVLGTILGGILPVEQTLEAARIAKDFGGLELFDAEWAVELWRRIEASMAKGKPPHEFLWIKQVEHVPVDIIGKLGDSCLPIGLVEAVYLPELAAASRERKIRRAMKEAADGGDVEKALAICRESQQERKKEKSKADICNEALDDWTEALNRPGQISGVTSGLADLDRITGGWQAENLVIIGARPSQGKTALLIGMSRSTAVEHKIPTLFLSLESSPKELIKRMACQIANASQTRLRDGEPTKSEMARLGPAFSEIHSAPIYFVDCSGMSIATIQNMTRRIVKNYGIKFVVVDYLQKIKPSEKHEKRTYEVAQASEGLKNLAKELNVPIVVAAQLNREPEKQKGRAPVLSDLADSGQIERDADIVGLLHRDKEGQTWLMISKFRDGPTGSVKLVFEPSSAKFKNASRVEDDYADSQTRSAQADP